MANYFTFEPYLQPKKNKENKYIHFILTGCFPCILGS